MPYITISQDGLVRSSGGVIITGQYSDSSTTRATFPTFNHNYYNGTGVNITRPSTSIISVYTSQSTPYIIYPPFYATIYEYKPKINYKQIRIKRDYARKALYKSIRLFENLFGINKIQLFLNGEAFEIEGRKFNYRISKKKFVNLIEHTSNPTSAHIPYKLEILSKAGLVLFEGCTIFKNTPVVDQIIALILHIQDNEEHVLLNMNLSKKALDFSECSNDIEYLNHLKGTNYVT
jgi:hypothetical protein